jgi:hypothetical protein
MQLSNDTGIWRAEQTSHEANSKGVVPGRIHVQRFTILEHLSEVFGGNGVISPSNFPRFVSVLCRISGDKIGCKGAKFACHPARNQGKRTVAEILRKTA